MAEEHCTRLCSVDTCERASRVRGMCSMHWNRWRKHGDPEIRSPAQLAGMTCTVDWCERPARSRWAGNGPYCAKHYLQLNQTGRIKPKGNEPLDGRACSIDGCTNVARSRTADWCEVHYYRNRRKGSPLAEVIQKGGHESCSYCGALSQGRKYCSGACSSRGARAAAMAASPETQKARFIAQYHRRRARIKGAYVENVNPIEVMARDNWTCHLCGDRIPKRHKFPHPMSASIDHVIPLAAGGMHSYSNVKAAHLGCNCKKGATVKGQLGLPLVEIGDIP